MFRYKVKYQYVHRYQIETDSWIEMPECNANIENSCCYINNSGVLYIVCMPSYSEYHHEIYSLNTQSDTSEWI